MGILRLIVNKWESAVLKVFWKSVHACLSCANTVALWLDLMPASLLEREISLLAKLLHCGAMLDGRSWSLGPMLLILKLNALHLASFPIHLRVKTWMIVKATLAELTVHVWMASKTTVAIAKTDLKNMLSLVTEFVASMIATVCHAVPVGCVLISSTLSSVIASRAT